MSKVTRSGGCVVACLGLLVLTLVGRCPGAQPPAAPADQDPAAWLAHARAVAPPPRAELPVVQVRIAAVMALMGQPEQAVAYVDGQFAAMPQDHRRARVGVVPPFLAEAGDGEALAAYVTAATKAGFPMYAACRPAVETLVAEGLVEQAQAALRPMSAPGNPDARAGSRAVELADAARLIASAKNALSDSPVIPPATPVHLQEGKRTEYASIGAPAQAQAGQIDRALATVRDYIPQQQSTFRARTYARVARAALRQPGPDPAKLRGILAALEPLLQADGPNLHVDDDGARVAAMQLRARLGDRAGFERHLGLFRKKHEHDLPSTPRGLDLLLAHEVEGRLALGDVAGAKAAVEKFAPVSWSDLNPIYFDVARHFAAAGKLDDARSWIASLRAPELKPDTYAYACLGAAQGIWERGRRAAAAAAAAPAGK
jgi:hypothetical protein